MNEIKSKKILLIEIVEDEVSQRKALVDKFKRENFHVLEAKTGEEGLNIAINEKPDLILLDILMPDMDGITMLRELRQRNTWGKSVPVILLTNVSPDSEKINKEITKSEPAYYLMKANSSIEDIVEKVKERLSHL